MSELNNRQLLPLKLSKFFFFYFFFQIIKNIYFLFSLIARGLEYFTEVLFNHINKYRHKNYRPTNPTLQMICNHISKYICLPKSSQHIYFYVSQQKNPKMAPNPIQVCCFKICFCLGFKIFPFCFSIIFNITELHRLLMNWMQ